MFQGVAVNLKETQERFRRSLSEHPKGLLNPSETPLKSIRISFFCALWNLPGNAFNPTTNFQEEDLFSRT